MSTAPARLVRLLDAQRADPRAHRRYPILLDVDYKILSHGRVDRMGTGKTLNVSSGGACFECVDALPVEGSIELVINWPFLLEGVCPLKLIMRGRIVRIEGHRVAVRVLHHEFRTAGVRASREFPAGNQGRSLAR